MIPDRDPTEEEVQWVLRYLASKGWTKGRKGINARRDAVRRNGLLGGRPCLNPEEEDLRQRYIERLRSLSNEERLERFEELRSKYERDKERLHRAKELDV